MKKFLALVLVLTAALGISACGADTSSARTEAEYQETLMRQASDEVGMPEITEYYEKKLAKEIFELRDDSSLVCYAYTKAEGTGKYVYLGRCMGYGLPYSTQYTNPETPYWGRGEEGSAFYRDYPLPQADPNGLYSPDGLSATWLWMIDEQTGDAQITYAEPELLVSQGKLPARICEAWSLPSDY